MSVAFFCGTRVRVPVRIWRAEKRARSNSSPPVRGAPCHAQLQQQCSTASDLTAPLAVCGVDGLLTPATPENSCSFIYLQYVRQASRFSTRRVFRIVICIYTYGIKEQYSSIVHSELKSGFSNKKTELRSWLSELPL